MQHDELVDTLAFLEHEQWMELMQYLSNRLHEDNITFEEYIQDCNRRKLFVPFSQLIETQKSSDRLFARKVVKLLLEKGWMRVKNIPATIKTTDSQDH